MDSLGCFVCQSLNRSDERCEDPFNATEPELFQSDCQSYRKGRDGLFPASACVKVKGTYCKNNLSAEIINAAAAMRHRR